MGERIDVAGFVRRVRRWADLSQRELAARLGVSAAAVGRWETGSEMSVAMFERVLAVAGVQLAVVDETGRETAGEMRRDAVTDGGGRRYPAHLDVVATGPDEERWDRPRRDVFAPRRARRDRLRARLGEVQFDHPTRMDVAFDKQLRFELAHMRRLDRCLRQQESALAHRLMPPEPEPCECPIGCEETGWCGPGCPCQCEPGHEGVGAVVGGGAVSLVAAPGAG